MAFHSIEKQNISDIVYELYVQSYMACLGKVHEFDAKY
jgi:hypothetical protein